MQFRQHTAETTVKAPGGGTEWEPHPNSPVLQGHICPEEGSPVSTPLLCPPNQVPGTPGHSLPQSQRQPTASSETPLNVSTYRSPNPSAHLSPSRNCPLTTTATQLLPFLNTLPFPGFLSLGTPGALQSPRMGTGGPPAGQHWSSTGRSAGVRELVTPPDCRLPSRKALRAHGGLAVAVTASRAPGRSDYEFSTCNSRTLAVGPDINFQEYNTSVYMKSSAGAASATWY